MKDYTLAVNELRDHYNALRVFRKSVREQVKTEFESKIDFEIKTRTEAEELKFANHVAAVKERENLPVRVIQDHVLRTRTWSRWEYFRDLAGIPGEFVKAEDIRKAKEEAENPFHWAEDFSTLTVTKNSALEDIEPATYYLSTNRYSNGIYWPDTSLEGNGISPEYRAAVASDAGFREFVSDEIARRVEDGRLERVE